MNFSQFKKQYQKVEVTEVPNQVSKDPLVSVCIQTFQHSNFIKDCLEGVLMQKTNFEFEILLGEDASTDGTREICLDYAKAYPQKIRLFLHHRENNIKIKGSPTGRFNMTYTFFQTKGKFISLCQGDDYWTDPLKLQKQVDFLEENKKYSICWSKYYVSQLENEKIELTKPYWLKYFKNKSFQDIQLNNLFSPYCTYTLTSFFRKDSFNISIFSKMKYAKDNSIYAICLTKGRGKILDFYSAVYRLHNGGIYSGTSLYRQNYLSYLNLKEIIDLVKECNNENLRYIRNYHLKNSIILSESKFTIDFLILFFDAIRFLGIIKSLRLLNYKLSPLIIANG